MAITLRQIGPCFAAAVEGADLTRPLPPGEVAAIDLAITGLPASIASVKLTEWRIDETHSNAHTVWKSLGSPAKLDPEQRKKLEAASELAVVRGPADQAINAGKANIKIDLPRQGVSLIELTW